MSNPKRISGTLKDDHANISKSLKTFTSYTCLQVTKHFSCTANSWQSDLMWQKSSPKKRFYKYLLTFCPSSAMILEDIRYIHILFILIDESGYIIHLNH